MNLSEALKKEHSKAQTLRIGKYIGNDRQRFSEIVNLVRSNDPMIAQRAAWVMGTHGENHPQLFLGHLSNLIPLLSRPVHDAVKRNILRVLQYVDIPVKHEAALVSHCFDLLLEANAAPAIKAFSITVIVNLSRKYPDLLQELNAWFQQNRSVASKAECKRIEKAGLLNKK